MSPGCRLEPWALQRRLCSRGKVLSQQRMVLRASNLGEWPALKNPVRLIYTHSRGSGGRMGRNGFANGPRTIDAISALSARTTHRSSDGSHRARAIWVIYCGGIGRPLAAATGVNWEEVRTVAEQKRQSRGSFARNVVLMET